MRGNKVVALRQLMFRDIDQKRWPDFGRLFEKTFVLATQPIKPRSGKKNPASGGADAGQQRTRAGGQDEHAERLKHSQRPIVPPSNRNLLLAEYLPKSR
jgi:hypothetical protein